MEIVIAPEQIVCFAANGVGRSIHDVGHKVRLNANGVGA